MCRSGEDENTLRRRREDSTFVAGNIEKTVDLKLNIRDIECISFKKGDLSPVYGCGARVGSNGDGWLWKGVVYWAITLFPGRRAWRT